MLDVPLASSSSDVSGSRVLGHFRKLFRSKKRPTMSVTAGREPQATVSASELRAASWPPSGKPRIFLSYSRIDAAFAAEVRALIQDRSLAVWQDIPDMGSGRWWQQIEKVLSAPGTEHMVLLVSPDSLASEVVRKEWGLARQMGVQVSPVRVPDRLGKHDFAALPGWMKAEHFFDLGKPEQVERFLRGLEGPIERVRAPNMAPEPDVHFVLRKEEGEQLMALLLNGENAAVGITAALRGAGGYGKTQLARWLAHETAVKDAFYDGILWVEPGEDATRKLHDLIESLTAKLTGAKPGLANVTMAAAHLKETIGDRRMLLVIDDVWNKSDLDPFLGGAPNLVRLVTTRFDHVLPTDAAKVPVDAMQPAEAVALLAVGLVPEEGDAARPARLAEVEAARPALIALAHRLGEWPLLLTLANAQLRAEVEGGASVADAIEYAERLYDEAGLDAFDSGDEASRNSAARLSIGASLKRLDAGKGELTRFKELALFPEDVDIPAATIARLWHTTSGLAPLAGEVLLRTLVKWALLLGYDRAAGTVRLHDVVRKFLRDRAGKAGIARQAQVLATAYADLDGATLQGAERQYYYRHLPQHLHEAGELAKLDALLMSPAWMQAKLPEVGARPLIDDYRYARTEAQRLTGQTLELIGGVLARDERQLVSQLLGRMRADLASLDVDSAAINGLLGAALPLAPPPALIPRWASLTQPGGPEVRRFEGHTDRVNTVAFASDGCRLVSGSHDCTLRLWEVKSGSMRVLTGHGGPVKAVAFSPNGRYVISGSSDSTLRLWQVDSGTCRVLGKHAGEVRCLAFSPDGCSVVSGSVDRTVRLWEVVSGASRVLTGHRDTVNAVAFSPNGYQIVSGSSDRALWLWDLPSGKTRALDVHNRAVISVAFSPDGARVISGSRDGTLRVCELASGATRALEERGSGKKAVALSPDGRCIVSADSDGTLRLWEMTNGAARALKGQGGRVYALAFHPDSRHLVSGAHDGRLRMWEVAGHASRALDAHTRQVNALAYSPDSRHVVSSSYSSTLLLWDVQTGTSRVLKGSFGSVKAVAFSPNNTHILVGGADGPLRLWQIENGALRKLEGHRRAVNAVAFSPDGTNIVSGSFDGMRIWEVSSGNSRVLAGHVGAVNAVAYSTDGRHVVSGSSKGILHIWEVTSGVSRTLGRHRSAVNTVAFSPNSRHVVSGSNDGTLRVWEVASGAAREFKCNGSRVKAVAFSPDCRYLLSGSSDSTLRLWEVASGRQIARLDGDFDFLALSLAPDGKSLAAGDSGGRVHLIDIILDEADKAAWLARQPG
jgi:WD40 repeat protein